MKVTGIRRAYRGSGGFFDGWRHPSEVNLYYLVTMHSNAYPPNPPPPPLSLSLNDICVFSKNFQEVLIVPDAFWEEKC